MSAIQPVALYAVQVPPDGVIVPAAAGAPAGFRVTMAAIDPDAKPQHGDEDGDKKKAPRATLKFIRVPGEMGDESDSEDEDYADDGEDDDEDESDDDEVDPGPSDRSKAKAMKASLINAAEDDDDEDDDESDGDVDLKSAVSKLLKGKGRATEDDDSDEEDLDVEEFVLCTLDPERNYQQALDLVVRENERIFYKVTGTHTVYLSGNYVMPVDSHDHDHGHDDESDEEESDEEDYDLSPDEDELELMDEDEESDELDNLENPRVTEIGSDEEEEPADKEQKKEDKKGEKKEKKSEKEDKKTKKEEKPEKKADKKDAKKEEKGAKGKNKRGADEEPMDLDEMVANADKKTAEEKKNAKKVKKNDGQAAQAEEKKEGGKNDKKVQFAKNIEQSSDGPKSDAKPAAKQSLGVKNVQGVTVDDRKIGEGQTAKKGDKVHMRYIGKLKNGKVFDANKKGKPFSFQLGRGEVIKGWDVGVAGMAVGGERRLTIPANLAYGSTSLPAIPANSDLVFDIKLINIK